VAVQLVQLAIFDCDGVLVDSEGLSTGLLLKMAAPYGPLPELETAKSMFIGRRLSDCINDLERHLGRKLPATFVDDYRSAMAAVFETELKPIDGIGDALDRLTVPVCVASGGPRAKIELSLWATGLLPHVTGRVFSSYEVGVWKPDPGLFLHAAKALGVEPNACVVIEDSLPGMLAGLAAGMRVIAYAPDGDLQRLADNGVETFRHMRDLPALLNA
jgi:HAD superfamily hydrolase (TIGR01509 family)